MKDLLILLGLEPQGYSFLIKAGDRICYSNKGEQTIYLKANPLFHLKWSLAFFLIGIFILVAGFTKIEHFNVATILMVVIPSFLFIGVGIGYGYRLKQKSLYVLDPEVQVFNMHNRNLVPFEEIAQFELVSRYDGSSDSFSNRRIYELYLTTNRKIKHQFIQSENPDEIKKIGELLSSSTGKKLIQLNK